MNLSTVPDSAIRALHERLRVVEKIANACLLALCLAAAAVPYESQSAILPGTVPTVQVDWDSTPSEASSRPGYSRSAATGKGLVSAPRTPMVLNYQRSGPSAAAALYAVDPTPSLGAAHQLDLALELADELSASERDALILYGPWLTSDGLSNNAQQLIRAIQNATVHGLNPESYGLSQILRTVDTLTNRDKNGTRIGHAQRSVHLPAAGSLRQDLSRQMDDAFVHLISHLGQGVVDARAIQRELYRDVPDVQADKQLDALYSGQRSALQVINAVTPVHAEYQRLSARLRNLLTERATGIERASIDVNRALSESMIHDSIMDIKYRLLDTGELPPNAPLTPLFDAHLVAAIKQFQQRHGILGSGVVDVPTLRALNLSIDEEIEAIALSLERWRWMPRDLGDKHLYVNIPDYHIEFRDGADTKMSMVVVVGAVEHNTPTFSRDLTYMDFNPTWTVPTSIANNELIPKERRQPGYLTSRQFEFLKRTDNQLVPVPAAQVSADDFREAPFPYVLRQRAGPYNALGRMKFMMPNPYAIYLHDTQAKTLFTLNDRAFSHGCIRLSEPETLATLLMLEDGYEQSEISAALASRESSRVRLRTPIPTHLSYFTTWVDRYGVLQRRADIYGHDAALRIALQASGTLLSLLNRQPTVINTPMLLADSQ